MIEAIPNVSEGRDAAIIAALENAVCSVSGIVYLGTAPDPDHNRTVLSYASSDPAALRQATLRLFEVAIERIDLRIQKGEHPRVGVVDVLPFVPLAGTEMPECVALSTDVAKAVSEKFSIPVFLYEYASRDDYRRALPAIRSGGLSKLSRKMETPEWEPDFGPAEPHPSAGVAIIGARRPLIAFNIQLSTDDLAVAEEIARAVREISGGLPAVRAIPIRLASRGVVQVSMNLLDYGRTSMWEAFSGVKREAESRGVKILSSQLIGLAPAAALLQTAAQSLSLENFSMAQVLENEIEKKVQSSKLKVESSKWER